MWAVNIIYFLGDDKNWVQLETFILDIEPKVWPLRHFWHPSKQEIAWKSGDHWDNEIWTLGTPNYSTIVIMSICYQVHFT